MDIESLKLSLYKYDNQITSLENKIKSIREEIAETEKAQENSKGIRIDFDNFISRKKQRNARDTKGKLVNSFSSFLGKVSDLLTGSDYNSASEKIDEISNMLSSKLKNLYDDLDYCKDELVKLKSKRSSIYTEYISVLNSSDDI